MMSLQTFLEKFHELELVKDEMVSIMSAKEESEKKADSYEAVANMYRDSLGKTIDNSKDPITYTSGMYCVANLWYNVSTFESDGLKDVETVKKYVCVKEGIVNESNFSDCMELFDN